MIFLTDGGEVVEDSMFGYCTNDAKKGGHFSGRKISSMFHSIYRKLCPTGKGKVMSHCSDWWGDGSGDMYGYKMELITLGFDKYYLLLKDNFLKSPYPNTIYSRYFGVKTLDRLREKEII